MVFEKYKLAEGQIMIAHSDENLSFGVLELKPGQELRQHNRPAVESLFQISGSCLITIFNGEQKEIELSSGESIEIPRGTYHIHANPFSETSITLWKAEGDIREIIAEIKRNNTRV